MTKNKETVF